MTYRTPEQRRSFWLLTSGVALVAASMLSGLLQLYGLPGGDDGEDAAVPRSPASSPAEPAESEGGVLGTSQDVRATVVRFARTGSLLSVEVRNDSGVALRSARVRVVARDDRGRVVSKPGAPLSSCCTLIDVPAGGSYGAWADLPRDAPAVRDVEVEVLSARVDRTGRTTPEITASQAAVERGDGTAVVTATLTTAGPVRGQVAAQAFVAAPGERLVAVVSGRFGCFSAGGTRTVRMELPQPVPRGARVTRVIARVVPADTTPTACPEPGEKP